MTRALRGPVFLFLQLDQPPSPEKTDGAKHDEQYPDRPNGSQCVDAGVNPPTQEKNPHNKKPSPTIAHAGIGCVTFLFPYRATLFAIIPISRLSHFAFTTRAHCSRPRYRGATLGTFACVCHGP